MSKKYLQVKEKVLGCVELEDNLVDCLKQIQEYIDEYGDTAYFNREYYGYDGAYELELWRFRQETDAERDKRLAKLKKQREKNKAAKEAKEQKEREMYEKLKERYGK